MAISGYIQRREAEYAIRQKREFEGVKGQTKLQTTSVFILKLDYLIFVRKDINIYTSNTCDV